MYLVAVNVGQSESLQDYHGKHFQSAVRKKPQTGELQLTVNGIAGDEVVDTLHHGGSEKALHIFPYEHYAYFESQAGEPLPIATFGENLTIAGYCEQNIHVGDQLQLGTALIEISQPTERCRTMGRAIHQKKLLKWIHQHLMTGVYARVLKSGTFSINSEVTLVHKGPDELNVARLNQQLFHSTDLVEDYQRVCRYSELSEQWKRILRKRLARTNPEFQTEFNSHAD